MNNQYLNAFSTQFRPGDFSSLLAANGIDWQPPSPAQGLTAGPQQTQATTVLAIKFAGGVLMAGDRRATAGNVVVYDRADKVLPLDDYTLLGIAGVPAFAWEMARMLSHSFKYFRRSQLQELSLEGKLRSLSAILRGNLPWLMQGVGIVAPILASWEEASQGRLFTYDPLGAEFEGVSYATSGSGSGVIEAILLHRTRYEGKPLQQLNRDGAIALALQLLEAAADSDSATGGIRAAAGIYPSVHWIDGLGVQTAPESLLKKLQPTI